MAETRICSVENCGKPYVAKGFCQNHYRLMKRHGTPVSKRPTYGAAKRFITETMIPFAGDECLIWPYSGVKGYGTVHWEGKRTLVTRIACEAMHGLPPTERHEAAHNCGNGKNGCCNPRHLQWKTHADNMSDTVIHGTSTRGKRQGSAKLTDEAVKSIRQLHGTFTYEQLARQFSVSPGCIGAVVRRENWDWL